MDVINRIRDRFRNRDPLEVIADIYLDSPAGQQALAEGFQKEADDRRRHGDAIAAAERERDEKLPALDKTLAAKVAARKKAWDAFRAAQDDETVADVQRRSLLHNTEHRIGMESHALRAMAPECIGTARATVEARIEAMQRRGIVCDTEPNGYNTWSGVPVMKVVSTNAHTIGPWLEGAADARRDLEILSGRYSDDYERDCNAILNRMGEAPPVEAPSA